MSQETLYVRLGGYDAISAVVGDLLPRLQHDPLLAHFWQRRPEDSLKRSKQLLIDFLCANAGGPVYYTGRDMKTSHKGMRLTEADWSAFMTHLHAALDTFRVQRPERDEVVSLIGSTKNDMVEA
ncbi:MAG: group 1 truncated hemoglobin [Burkholderiales bacterium]|nr:MAG: group 1 truncated hemoglobin [Burkholderiales bacterium]